MYCVVWTHFNPAEFSQVVVTDGGLLTDRTLVTINVTDVNDNRPYFDPNLYIDSFSENQMAHLRFPFQVWKNGCTQLQCNSKYIYPL